MFSSDVKNTKKKTGVALILSSFQQKISWGELLRSPQKGYKNVASGKLTWQWKMNLLKMYSLLNTGIFHCHVSLLEGKSFRELLVAMLSQESKQPR